MAEAEPDVVPTVSFFCLGKVGVVPLSLVIGPLARRRRPLRGSDMRGLASDSISLLTEHLWGRGRSHEQSFAGVCSVWTEELSPPGQAL